MSFKIERAQLEPQLVCRLLVSQQREEQIDQPMIRFVVHFFLLTADPWEKDERFAS